MQQISRKQLEEELIKDNEIFLLDVRERNEHEEFNIGGILIPLGEVVRKASEIPRDKMVIVYCRKGIRSQIAIQRLESRYGFTNLVNLAGGIDNCDADAVR